MTIILYYFAPSPPARTALMTIRALDLDAEIKEVDLAARAQLSEEFIKINPQHTVPTLDDGGFILWESRAIASYLVRQYGKDDTLYPQDPQLKALVDQRLYFDCSTLGPRLGEITYAAFYLGESKVPEKKKNAVNDAIAFLEVFLNGRDWVAGDQYTIADLSLYATMSSILALGWDVSGFPNVTAWFNRCKTLPGAEENDVGAKMFGDKILSLLEPGQI